MARTTNSADGAEQPDADEGTEKSTAVPQSAPAPGGHHVGASTPIGEVTDISQAVGATEGGPVVLQPAPMFWMRSELTGNVYPAFNLGQREELANNGCEELPLDQVPDGMPRATGMAGTGLLA